MKKVVLMIISIVMVMTLAGCGTSMSLNAQAQRYIEKKYAEAFDDEFTLDYTRYAGLMNGSYDTFWFKSKNLGTRFIVERSCDKEFSDNYMNCYFSNESGEALKNIIEPIVGECQVFAVSESDTTTEYDSETTFDEYFHSYYYDTVVIFDSVDQYDVEQFKKAVEALGAEEIKHHSVRFVVMAEDKEFANYEEYNDYTYEVTRPYLKHCLIVVRDYEISRIDELNIGCKISD